MTEFDALMPSLGEIFKTAEHSRTFLNVSCGVHKQLIEKREDIDSHVEKIRDTKMSDISGSVKLLKNLIADLIAMKKKAIFNDKKLSNEIFQEIRNSAKKE